MRDRAGTLSLSVRRAYQEELPKHDSVNHPPSSPCSCPMQARPAPLPADAGTVIEWIRSTVVCIKTAISLLCSLLFFLFPSTRPPARPLQLSPHNAQQHIVTARSCSFESSQFKLAFSQSVMAAAFNLPTPASPSSIRRLEQLSPSPPRFSHFLFHTSTRQRCVALSPNANYCVVVSETGIATVFSPNNEPRQQQPSQQHHCRHRHRRQQRQR
jgi:hypothetical protein